MCELNKTIYFYVAVSYNEMLSVQFIKSFLRIDTEVVACQKKLLSGDLGLLVPLLGLAHPTAEALGDLTTNCYGKASNLT